MGRLDYLLQYGSKSTVKAYRLALKDFFQSVYEERDRLDELAERYFQEPRDYEEDVQRFLVFLKGRPPKTVRLKLSAVRVFLVENGVELPERFWRRLRGRIKGSRAVSIDRVPSNVELRRVMMHLPVHGKALFLTLASSGMRIGEALQLKLGDIDLDAEPARIRVRAEYTKSGNPRIAFISREARDAVREWLRVRPQYLEAAAGKSHRYAKSREDPRVFPFTDANARFMWRNALKKSGLKEHDDRTNRTTLHPHVLRKFFRSRMGAVIPVDVVEALMGHEGYLTEVYRRYSEEDLAQFYLKGEHTVLVFTEAAEIGRLRREVEERNRQLQALVNGLTAENLELRSRLAQLELQHTEFRKKVLKEVQELKKMILDLIGKPEE